MDTKAYLTQDCILTAGNGHVPGNPKILIIKAHSDGGLQESNLSLYTVMGNPNRSWFTSSSTCKYLYEIVMRFYS